MLDTDPENPVTELKNTWDFEEGVKKWTLKILLLVGGVSTLTVGLFGDQNTNILWNIFFTLQFLVLYLVLHFRNRIFPVDSILLFSITFSIPLIVLYKGRSNLDIIWFLIYPGVAYFLQGLKWGLIWSHVYLLVYFAVFACSMFGFCQAVYTLSDNITVLLLGFLIQAIFLLYELRRLKIEGNLKTLTENLRIRVKEEIQKGKKQEQIIQQQARLTAMGKMVRAITHQWKQPLNTISLIVQDMEDAYEEGEFSGEYLKSGIEHVMEEVAYMSQTMEDFRSFITGTSNRAPFNILSTLEEAVRLATARLKHQNVVLDIACKSDGISILECRSPEIPNDEFTIIGPGNEFKQIILNIINNSIDAIEEQAEVNQITPSGKIQVYLEKNIPEEEIHLVFHDSGPGIPDEYIAKVQDPYFTTRSKGSGLGLYLAGNLMKVFPGELKIKSNQEISGGYVELVFYI